MIDEGSSTGLRAHARARRRRLRAAAASVLLIGVAASAFAGARWHEQAERQREDALARRIDAVAAAVSTLVQRNNDITNAALALVAALPDLDSATFQGWFDRIMASERYPGVQALGYIQITSPADAPGVLARLAGDAATMAAGRPADGSDPFADWDLTLDPSRPYYCLPGATALGADTRGMVASLPPAFRALDLCSTPLEEGIALTRDAGTITASVQLPGTYVIGAPFYGTGEVPDSVAERRATFAGVMGATVNARALLDTAVGDEELWLQLARTQSNGTVDVIASSGNELTDADVIRTVSVEADGPWRLRVAANDTTGGMSPWAQGMGVFLLGSLVTWLVAAILALAGRSRERALELVDERTAELKHLALHDQLTDLPNRALVLDRASHMLRRAERSGVSCAAMFIDLDRFKDINDTLGHQAGDMLLAAVAGRLSRVVRECDTVGRIGGDEFVILLDGDGSRPAPELVAERVLEVLRPPFRLTDAEMGYSVTASIGVALGRGESAATELLRNADVALYEAKSAGRNRYVVFESEMHEAVQGRLELAMQLREAVQRQELFVEYQPTFDIETNEVKGLEALVRWAHPTRGIVPPLEFIPIAEETDVILELGAWVLRKACTQMARWRAEGYELEVNVNVSSQQLDRPNFADVVAEALRESGLPPEALVLEITESILSSDASRAATQLGRLKQLGVKIAIDDFGTGYSSLSYLRDFPVDSIKIDRSFLTDLGHTDESSALLHSLIQLGKNLGLETVAEGIEDKAQVDHLRREQCDTGQGYLFARPLDLEAANAFLADVCPIATPN